MLDLWVKEDDDKRAEDSGRMMEADLALVAFAVLEEEHCTLQQEMMAENALIECFALIILHFCSHSLMCYLEIKIYLPFDWTCILSALS